MYGYQIIDELKKQSNNIFELKAGTLYPLLHLLEQNLYLESREAASDSGRTRKYYHITYAGRNHLQSRLKEWEVYSTTVNSIMSGGASFVRV
jgi:Predicted transcriptional regulators